MDRMWNVKEMRIAKADLKVFVLSNRRRWLQSVKIGKT